VTVLAVAPHVDVTVIDGQGLVATTLGAEQVFSGSEYAALGSAVDGARTEEEIMAAVPEAGEALAALRTAGVVVELDEALPHEEAAFWSAERVPPSRVAERLTETTVAVHSVGETDGGAVRDALAAAGVALVDDGGLALVLADDYLDDGLAARNAEALETGRAWMTARPSATEAWIGPVFVPDRGACWECLAHRLRLHRPLGAHLRQAGVGATALKRERGSLTSTRMAVAGMIATTVVRWIVLEGASMLGEALLSVDTHTWQTGTHQLTWRPQCPACGEPGPPENAVARPVALAGRGERLAPAGSLRTVPAESTVERFVRHVSPVTGVVDRLVRNSAARPPMHAYLAGNPGPEIHGDAPWLPRTMGPAGGKGATDEQARASALCEALERYSGRYGGEEPRRAAAFDELGDEAVHPNAVMGFSEAQYAARETTNSAARSMRTFVPGPLDPSVAIDWTPLWSLTAESERLLPTAACYYDAPVAGREACFADSNGNAAGNTIEEAILQGFLELVERDHVALWWYNRLRRPGLDLESFGDPWLGQLQARFAQDERELWALDLTSDLGIPVVGALTAPAGDPDGPVALGFGAHFDLGLALQRAAAELVQLTAGVPSGGLGHGSVEPVGAATAHVRPDPAAPVRGSSAIVASGDLRADVDACVQLLDANGLEMMVLDQTRADVGLPVVKVVVPGLRHFWPRFAPGRLYDVPVALGELRAPTPEAELNPTPPVA
jgi:ribosomal protein S12 methylthiotransferase accessory factor